MVKSTLDSYFVDIQTQKFSEALALNSFNKVPIDNSPFSQKFCENCLMYVQSSISTPLTVNIAVRLLVFNFSSPIVTLVKFENSSV